MPTQTFFDLPAPKQARIVEEAITEFSERSFEAASLSAIVRRLGIAKGSIYQYFRDKEELYHWLMTEEVPRRKADYSAEPPRVSGKGFWERLEWRIERGIGFLVEHPRLARLTAAAADPAAPAAIRGLYRAVCDQGHEALREFLRQGVASGALPRTTDLDLAATVVTSVTGPGLTDVILRTLDAEMHEILSDDALRARIDTRMRRRLARKSVAFLRNGLGGQTTKETRR